VAKIAPVAWAEFIKGLRKFDFDGPFRGGKHPYMVKDDIVLTHFMHEFLKSYIFSLS
jgi:hypothetical protein